MKDKIQHSFMTSLRGKIGICIIVMLGCLLSVTSAEAVLTPQSISGTVEVLLAGEQAWKPLTAAMKLKAGDQVRTSTDGSVDLWFEDGSVLSLAEDTQIAISELDISMPQKTRVARFKMSWGEATAKITKLAFTESICEIETSTVVAGVKFSEMKVRVPKDSSRSDVIALQGMIEILKTGEGLVNVFGLVDDQEGLTFSLDTVGSKVFLGVQKIVRKITLEAEISLSAIRAMIGNSDNIMKVENLSSAPLMVNYSGISAILEQDKAATFGIPIPHELLVEANKLNASFWFKQRAAIGCDGFYVFADVGPIDVGGQSIKTGSFNCFPVDSGRQKSRALAAPEEKPATRAVEPQAEEPVVAPAPDAQSPEGAQETTPTPTQAPPAGSEDTLRQAPEPTATPTSAPSIDYGDEQPPSAAPPPPPTPTSASPTQP